MKHSKCMVCCLIDKQSYVLKTLVLRFFFILITEYSQYLHGKKKEDYLPLIIRFAQIHNKIITAVL